MLRNEYKQGKQKKKINNMYLYCTIRPIGIFFLMFFSYLITEVLILECLY